MNSEPDSSFASFTSVQSVLKKSRSQTSAVWTHCWTVHDDEDLKFKYCTHCTTSSSYCTNISFNMQMHLQRCHQIDIEASVNQVQMTALEQLEQLYLWVKLSDQIEAIDAQVFEKQLDQDIINEALILLIVVWNVSFQIIEWSEFHAFYQILNSQSDHFITTAHSQIRWKMRDLWQTHKNTVQKKLQSALFSIHLSVDIWTSSNQLLLLAVTADFVDYTEKKYMKILLALHIVKDHNEEAQFAVLLSVLQNYDIVQKLEAVVTDNSDTNDTLCQEIEAHFLKKENLVWKISH